MVLRLLFRFRIEGLSQFPAGPAVVVANHPSALDPVFIGVAVSERVLFLAAEEYLTWRGVGWAMRAYGCIPVRRDETDTSAIREAVEALDRGLKVGVFPEGQITPAPRPVKRGAALLAARARVPLVPLAVIGSGEVFPLGAKVPRLARVTVRIGTPLPPPGPGRDAQQAAMDAVMDWIRAQQDLRPARRTPRYLP
ncbi:MAG: lysophospholipid acyltransferase family protein [Armatimonadota bacterium]|nr:lysophospholipid acyltransferase family protein [Armatimonadota bacterium]